MQATTDKNEHPATLSEVINRASPPEESARLCTQSIAQPDGGRIRERVTVEVLLLN